MHTPNISRYIHKLIILGACCFYLVKGEAQNQQPIPSPSHLWVSLSSSSLSPQSPDWAWVRKQESNANLLQTLKPVGEKLQGVIVPVFDEGRAYYETQVPPFKGRNLLGSEDDRALRALLIEAKKRQLPVLLAVDVLGWQKQDLVNVPPQEGIFADHADWREARQSDVQGQQPEAFYASPWNTEVRDSLRTLMTELGEKFPDASGVVLNLRLSDREILGFSESARLASIQDIGADPVDLNLQNRSDDNNNQAVQQWREWRRTQMGNFIRVLRENYVKANPKGKVMAFGAADYYIRHEFNDLRSGQDWREWIQNKFVDGVLLEGRWTPRYSDAGTLVTLSENKAIEQTSVLPIISGSALTSDSNFAEEWSALQNRVDHLNQSVFTARNNQDLHQIVDLAINKTKLQVPPAPILNEPFPDLALRTPEGENWQPRNIRGQASLTIFINPDAVEGSTQILEKHVARLKNQAIDLVLVGRNEHNTNVKISHPNVSYLIDERRELLGRYSPNAALLVVDRAGYLRNTINISSSQQLNATLEKLVDPTPELRIGEIAPNFTMIDMNGKLRKLSDLRGQKNLLLTFFPKCFTGGCANHLRSLKENFNAFKSSSFEIWAVSIDPPDVQIAFAQSLNLPFPLIPDVGRNQCLLYNSVDDILSLPRRMTILIDKKGVVRYIDTNVNVYTHGADVLKRSEELGL